MRGRERVKEIERAELKWDRNKDDERGNEGERDRKKEREREWEEKL